MPGWRIHDLRRTMATGFQRLGTANRSLDRTRHTRMSVMRLIAANPSRFELFSARKWSFAPSRAWALGMTALSDEPEIPVLNQTGRKLPFKRYIVSTSIAPNCRGSPLRL